MCGNYSRHGGSSSFSCYLRTMIVRACSERVQVCGLADLYIRQHLHKQSAACRNFELSTEVDRVTDAFFAKARAECAEHYDAVKNTPNKQYQNSYAKNNSYKQNTYAKDKHQWAGQSAQAGYPGAYQQALPAYQQAPAAQPPFLPYMYQQAPFYQQPALPARPPQAPAYQPHYPAKGQNRRS